MSDFKAKKALNSISAGAPRQNIGELAALPRSSADPIPALGPPGLETTCLPKYVALNLPMLPTLPHVLRFLNVSLYRQYPMTDSKIAQVDSAVSLCIVHIGLPNDKILIL